ncbi:unnamed protein product [Sphagnum troendelagicum]|uniref:9-cis-epoxycarotenoid dioxygenase n=1 Tax=Sphagnum troendelagicum TaxID=128251 RepID=A0ABP0V0R7_9BRYO
MECTFASGIAAVSNPSTIAVERSLMHDDGIVKVLQQQQQSCTPVKKMFLHAVGSVGARRRTNSRGLSAVAPLQSALDFTCKLHESSDRKSRCNNFHGSFGSSRRDCLFSENSGLSCLHGSSCSQAPTLASITTPVITRDVEEGFSNLAPSVPPPAPEQNLNLFQRITASVLDWVEKTGVAGLESKFQLPAALDPSVHLQGNYAPVEARRVMHELEVMGKLPQGLEGMYVRNGANPQFVPTGGHHLFDGDGMLHAVQFKQGIVSYSCSFTRTYRFVREQEAGRPLFPKAIGELHGHGGVARLLLYTARSICGFVDQKQGMGVANAGVVFHNGHLLAMSEDDLPYQVRMLEHGELETVGRYDCDGQLSSSTMIAHPKVDPVSGELFALSYSVVTAPFLKYFYISPQGIRGPEVSITLPEPTMIHDFAITENFAVIPDQQIVFCLKEMFSGGSPVVHNSKKTSRFGILPKYDQTEARLQWIDVPDCFCFHLWNAWEEKEDIVVIGSCMTPPDSIFIESDEALKSTLSEIRLNRTTGVSTRHEITSLNLEAGQINHNFLGRKSRYMYLAIAEPWPKVSGIAKVDLVTGEVTKYMYGHKCYGGEPTFVPHSSDPLAAEDDGSLLVLMHNENTDQSKLLVLDAASASLQLEASVKLPSRVPYGFHGTFVTAKELAKQQ